MKGNKMNKAMYLRIKESKEKEGGFTLIELLIVVVILGILAAVVILASGGFKDKGAVESCRVNISTIKTAAEAFRSDDPAGNYPATFAELQAPVKYFDNNGVTHGALAADILSGKGWKTTVTFAAATAPSFTTGGGTAFTPADALCTKIA
jgi:prepilin-type N-terminal cleavage/methylation domain-containing protein